MKTALITGAYRGLGLEIARQLGRQGFRVFITGRKPDLLEAAVKLLHSENIEAHALPLDVTNLSSILYTLEILQEQGVQLDVLINNAALRLDADFGILEVPLGLVEQTLRTNAIGPLLVTRTFLPILATKARVINISSSAGKMSDGLYAWAPMYAVSKTTLNAITLQLATALGDRDVAVNAVCPGWLRTEMGGTEAPRSVEQGADTVVWLATEAPHSLRGKFLRDRKEMEW